MTRTDVKAKKNLFAALGCPVALLAVSSANATGLWLDNYQNALDQAKIERKPVLLDFTGSDWCGWCMKLDRETFSTPQFKAFAKQRLILVTVDFPKRKPLSPDRQLQNTQLSEQFGVQAFPTLVLLDSDGTEMADYSGYMAGGPKAMIAWIESFAPKAATQAGTSPAGEAAGASNASLIGNAAARVEDDPRYGPLDARLNAVYSTLRAKLPPAKREELKQFEREFLARRDRAKDNADAFFALTEQQVDALQQTLDALR